MTNDFTSRIPANPTMHDLTLRCNATAAFIHVDVEVRALDAIIAMAKKTDQRWSEYFAAVEQYTSASLASYRGL